MMTGSNSLDVILGKSSIAKISLVQDQLFWHYNEAWQQEGYAVSPHLPLNNEIPSVNVQRFLRNLLPEGYALDELLHYLHLSKNNTFGLVRALGLDISGSLILLPEGKKLPTKSFFRLLPENELIHRLRTRDDFSLLVWDGKPRLSVAGVQDKINIVLNQKGQLGFGEEALCSTHILKFEKQKLSHLALNEFISMQLAKHCGLIVANVKLIYLGDYSTLLVERFDRQFVSLSKVKRRHVIDGCQALNLPPEYKYERNFGSGRDVAHIRNGASYEKLFEFANQCTNPALTKQKLIDWALFNILIYNYDAHGKNISFFIGSNGISLTPFYDLVNIKMYPDFEQEMAMALGDSFDGENVNAYQLADFAESCHLPRSLVVKRLKTLISKIKDTFENQIKLMNKSERDYLKKYQKIVYTRSQYLLEQADEIISVVI